LEFDDLPVAWRGVRAHGDWLDPAAAANSDDRIREAWSALLRSPRRRLWAVTTGPPLRRIQVATASQRV
jgi:hypothetical protein